MKKQFALGLLAAVCASGAFAQSSVTVYGRLNVTVESIKIGDGDRQGDVHNNSSRIGFKGTEDLGGGLKAGFQIEHGFDPTTGTANAQFWGRQAEVNLSGGFGTVRLGTWTPDSYYATSDYIGMHNHETGDSSDAFYASNFVTTNKVGYVTPNLSGFQAFVAVAESDQTSPNPNRHEKFYDFAAYYDAGPLHLGLGADKEGDGKQVAIRGLYEMGAFTVGALFQHDSGLTCVGDGRNYFRVSGMYAMGASEFHVNVGRANECGSGLTAVDASTQWTLGYNYNLSKRTKVYGYYTKVQGDGAIHYVGADGYDAFALGIRHNF
jgi:predicted porin